MKGKFSFNLAPIKVPSKAETKALKESLATRDIATPSSPFINRRILSPHTEAELRAACEAILKQDDNSYGQAAALQAAEANAADPLHRSMKTMQARRTESHPPAHTAPPRGAAKPIAAVPSTQPHKPNVAPSDASPEHHLAPNLIPANTSRGRNLHDLFDEPKSAASKAPVSQSEERLHRHTSRPTANERPRTGSIGRGLESPETSNSTPLSASTVERNPYVSTARTSAGVPSRCSKRNSHHVYGDEEAVLRADAEAANRMRIEHECCGREDTLHRPVSRTSQTASARRSVADIKEYFRPGSSQLSKSASRDSLGSRRSEAASAQPTPQKHGWRSWGVQRSSSSDSLGSRTGSIRGKTDRSQDGKKGINLNRELPPLPSLDQWKAPRPKAPYSKPSNPTHIANLMQVQPKAYSRRNGYDRQAPREHRTRQRADAGSRTASSQHSNDSDVPMHFQPRQQDPLTRDLASSHIDFDNLISAMKYTRKHDDTNLSNPSLADSGHGAEQPYQARRPSMKISIDQHGEKAPSFSRKARSMEDQSLDAKYKNVVQLKADETSPTSPVHSAMGGLKKVFTGLGLGKHKKSETWMDKFERSGVKGGILIHDEAAGAPVVRY